LLPVAVAVAKATAVVAVAQVVTYVRFQAKTAAGHLQH
jgi:uncharacterized protein YciW